MPIPELDTNGFLPVGVFDCTLMEVRLRFGTFQSSERRPRLFSRLKELIGVMSASGLFEFVLLDGSFVSAIPLPNDIDLIAVLPPDHNFEKDLSISDYALVSRTMLRRRFGFDVVLARSDSSLYDAYVEFFSRAGRSASAEGPAAFAIMTNREAILDQTVEQLELMSTALAALRREHLPSQPKTFAILAEGPLEEIRRLQSEIEQLTTEIAVKPAAGA